MLFFSHPHSLHIAPACSLVRQSCSPHGACTHSSMSLSVPSHRTSSSQNSDHPSGKVSPEVAAPRLYPILRHTTIAEVVSQPSSQTVPQRPLWKISKRPRCLPNPPLSRRTEEKVTSYLPRYWFPNCLDILSDSYTHSCITCSQVSYIDQCYNNVMELHEIHFSSKYFRISLTTWLSYEPAVPIPPSEKVKHVVWFAILS